MAQINKPTDYFNTVLYTGNGTAIGSGGNAITGVGFQPEFVWIKARSQSYNHHVYDIIRGVQQRLITNGTFAEATLSESLESFDTDGFTLGNQGAHNENGTTYASWNWLAGGSASSNTDGSITSQVSASTTSGFSIVSWTGSGSNATIGHGLGVAPSMIIFKNINDAISWPVYHKSLGATKTVYLNLTDASITFNYFQNTSPTSSVFSVVNDNAVSGSGKDMIAYCFAEKKGFSKFGSYTGNGSADGTFVYTGFKPAFVMWKSSSAAGGHWVINDNTRNPINQSDNVLFPNLSNAESTTEGDLDILSNGFKFRGSSNNNYNHTGVTYIYMAFAEQPLVGTNNIPATAR